MLKTSIAINDQHIPYEDPVAIALTNEFIEYIQPDYIDILGDMIDFYQISKFLGDPSRKDDIQDDIDSAAKYLANLRKLCPKSEITLHYGNHVLRLKKYIWLNARKLACIRSLDLAYMLDTKKLGIKVIDSEEGYVIRNGLVMTHGTVVSQDSGTTAKRNVQKYGLSVMCGHTHRAGAFFKTDLRGMVGGWENGCLCKPELIREWGREVGNWQQCFSLIDYVGSLFRVQQIPIIDGKFMFGKEVWRCDPKTLKVGYGKQK